MKFIYLGQTYSCPKQTFENNIRLNRIRRLLCASTCETTQSTRTYFFTIYSTDDSFNSCFSQDKNYYKRLSKHKHLQRGKLTRQECVYLTSLEKTARDFREYSALVIEALETIFEIS